MALPSTCSTDNLSAVIRLICVYPCPRQMLPTAAGGYANGLSFNLLYRQPIRGHPPNLRLSVSPPNAAHGRWWICQWPILQPALQTTYPRSSAQSASIRVPAKCCPRPLVDMPMAHPSTCSTDNLSAVIRLICVYPCPRQMLPTAAGGYANGPSFNLLYRQPIRGHPPNLRLSVSPPNAAHGRWWICQWPILQPALQTTYPRASA